MANSFWNFVTQLVPNNLAKAEDVNTNFSGVEAGFNLVEAQTLQSIKVTNTPGTINISDTPANRANKIVSFDNAGGVLASIYIGNYRNNHVGVAGTVYNVRDTVKDAAGAIGLNNIYICNTTHTSTGTLLTDTANWDILLDAAAAAASAAAALVSENNAQATFISFDERELGSKAADPTLNNQGGALVDGAQYFNTTVNKKKVYDLGNTVWILTTANAVDVTIVDAGTIFTATEVEAALQEVKVIADTAASTNITQDGRLTATEGVANGAVTVNTTQDGRLDTIEAINHLIILPPVTAGTTTAYTATVGITAYVIGTVYKVRINAANTASATISLDGLPATIIHVFGGTVLFADEMPTDHIAELYYNGTEFILLNPASISSAYVPTCTPTTSGTITLNTSLDSLSYDVIGGRCYVSGTLETASSSSPVGNVRLSLPIAAANLPEFQDLHGTAIGYTGLLSAVSHGVMLLLNGLNAELYELDGSGLSVGTLAAKVSLSRFYLEFNYRIR